MNIDTSGFGRLARRFEGVANVATQDNGPIQNLTLSWRLQMEEDNRSGILAGLDKDGKPMTAVTYRPKGEHSRSTWNLRSAAQRKAQRLGQPVNRKRGIFAGLGPHASGLNNNLTPAEYRVLSGPPLAPRGVFSRVISNFTTGPERMPDGRWSVYGVWNQVVSAKGVAFLKYHFNGEGRLPVRDLRGVRPEGIEKMRRSLRAWMRDVIKTYSSRDAA